MSTEFDIEETKPKKKLFKTTEKSRNLKEFGILKEEARRGRMPDRKKVALVSKLTGLYADGKLDDDETILMRDILVRDRARGILSTANTDILNKIEVEECEDKCYVRTPDAPRVLHLLEHKVCSYRFETDRNRYIVYVPIEIPGEFQLSMSAARKLEKGLELDAKEVPPVKTIFRRLDLKPKEFEAWFGYDDEATLGNKAATKPEYEF